MKTIKLILVSLILASTGFAQGLTVPKQYTLNTESDFDKYEHDVIECAKFLITTPVSQQTSLRREAAKFLTDYVSKSPTIKVELNQKATPFVSNPELLTIYLASWVKSYAAQNHINNKEEFTIRAANETLNYYKSNKVKIGKVKGIKKFLKLQADGKLKNHIKASL
jgi:phosphoribosylformylglycinamidine (FGAM) synthase PurS component